MTPKLKYLSLMIVGLLLAIFFMLQSQLNSPQNTLRVEPALFAIQDTSQIDRFEFGKHRLIKTGDIWTINNQYQVDEAMLRSLFSVMQSLEIKRPVSTQMSAEVRKNFDTNGIDIKIFQADKLLKHFQMAADDQDTYTRLVGTQELYSVYIPGFFVRIRDLFDIKSEDWRDKTVIETTWRSLKAVRIQYAEGKEDNLDIRFDSLFFKVQGVQALDSAKLYNYVTHNFTAFRVETFLHNPKLQDSLSNTIPYCNIEVEDVSPKRGNGLKVYRVRNRLYGILEKENQLVLLDPQRTNSLLATPVVFQRKNGE